MLFGLLLMCSLSSWGSTLPQRSNLKIVMVHSYDSRFEWTRSIDQGFVDTLSAATKLEVVERFYLDAKLHPELLAQKAKDVSRRLKAIDFNLLFVTDDNALELIGKSFFNTKKWVVFAGINRSLADYGLQGKSLSDFENHRPPNIAGILESYPITPLLELIKSIQPGTKKLNVFFDNSDTSRGVRESFLSEMAQSGATKYGFVVNRMVISNNLKEWTGALAKSKLGTEVNLIFPFSNLRDSSQPDLPISGVELARSLTKSSPALEFATASLTMNFPFFASVGIRGSEHGADAAHIAYALITNGPGNKISIGNYARLNINPDRAKELKTSVPFELLAYSYSLKSSGVR